MKRKAFARGVVAVSAVVLALAGCGGSSDDGGETAAAQASTSGVGSLYDKAKEEGSLTWYTGGTPESAERLATAFEKRYPGIDVQIQRLAPGDLIQRYQSERESGAVNADVVLQTDPAFTKLANEKGWYEKLAESELPALSGWPADSVTPTVVEDVGLFPLGILYNTDELGEQPPFATWEDLAKPEFAGDVTLVDPRPIATFMALANMWYEKYGPDFLRKLGEGGLDLVDSGVPGSQAVAAGESAMMIPTINSVVAPLADAGAPVAFHVPDYTTATAQDIAVSSDSSHPNAAKLLVNFIITPEGQEAYSQGGASLLSDVPGTTSLPSEYESPKEATDALTPERIDEISELLDLP